ncbi:MAG: protein translocase subunit SecF [Chloroflexota bacterium]|nr:protein translocase subunit SecF [Chloroflexota bacterium]
MLNFVEKRRTYFIITGVLILLSVVTLGISAAMYGSPLRISIDFTGGSLFVLQFEEPITEEAIREVFTAQGHTGAIIQQLGDSEDNLWQARTRAAVATEVENVFDEFVSRGETVDRERSSVDVVAPTVGAEVASNAAVAVLAASLVVLVFIWFSFRGVPHSIRYGAASIVAMVVNVIVAIGFYALMGILQGWEANALFLTALLTVIGFSVQDIIVVFDRVRENIPRHHGESFALIVNRSVMETVHRSLATQLNAMFIMIAILLFGGATIKPFIAVMLVGMLSETFTSLFVAAPILVVWDEYSSHR